MSTITVITAPSLEFPPDDEAELIRHFPLLLSGRSSQDVTVLRRCYLEKLSDADVAAATGLSHEVIRLTRESLKMAYYSLQDALQPPHAAD